MRSDLKLTPWVVESESGRAHDDFLESIFFTGNGRMGARGYLPADPERSPTRQGLFVAGIFGAIKPGITDFVNLPAPAFETLFLDGAPARPVSAVRRTLDLRSGVLRFAYRAAAAGRTADVVQERFFSLAEPALFLQRTEITARDPAEISLFSGVDAAACNCPVPDDQVKENLETVQLASVTGWNGTADGFAGRFCVDSTQLDVTQKISFRAEGLAAGSLTAAPEQAGVPFTARLAAGGRCVLDKRCAVFTGRDADPRLREPAPDWSWEAYLCAQRAEWAHRWAACDFPLAAALPGDDAQCALRYAMFQLFCSCSEQDPTVSIGARGLTHTRYKGCYFWDTDLFMLPFFLAADPIAARSLCEYRVRALPAAKAHAARMNAAGARYPWMAALDGSEQCETWDIGCSEVHVTADVAFGLAQYCRTGGDEAFYLDRAAAVFVETARFWRSRYTDRPGAPHADLLFCKGPDEYCGITNNNLYTNGMVRCNLELACEAAAALLRKRPQTYEKLGLSASETAAWQTLHDRIVYPRDPVTGRLTQDDTFHLLEPADIAALKPDDSASYHAVCFDRLQRYRVIKQADVLLLMTRFPQQFTRAEKLAAWQDFEPLCLHDSTLSFATHALFAAQNGLTEKARFYLGKALFLDLRDLMGSAGKEGLHLAGMGEAWQAAQVLARCGGNVGG